MARQAICTKFLPCTKHRPPRIKAWCERGSITVPWDHGQAVEDNHKHAVLSLLARFVAEDQEHGAALQSSWCGDWRISALPGGRRVAVSERYPAIQPGDIIDAIGEEA